MMKYVNPMYLMTTYYRSLGKYYAWWWPYFNIKMIFSWMGIHIIRIKWLWDCSCLPQRNKTAVVLSVYWNNKHTSTKMTKHLARLGRSCAAAPGVCGAGPMSARRGWHRASVGPHDAASQEVPMIKIWPRPALLKSTYSKWNTLL